MMRINDYQDRLLKRFLAYVKTDTRSDDTSDTTPSTKSQFELAKLIEIDLRKLGLKDINLTDKCYVTAKLPANTKKEIPTIGFIAHMDTSPEVSGKDVKPLIHTDFNGKDVELNAEKGIVLSIKEFPVLKKYKGQTIITTDGTTLLGADNKAGIAEIITAVEYLSEHPEIEHGNIMVGFTPDEEIGRGVDFFDVKAFNSAFAYTVDSGEIGSLEYETFNAASAEVIVKGKNVHPGTAKGIMLNAQLIATEFNAMLPQNERPEHTDNYEGFYHLIKSHGTVEQAELHYIIRDHDKKQFMHKKKEIQKIKEFINHRYGNDTVSLKVKDQYYNMREKIKNHMHIVDLAKKAYKAAGVTPVIEPIRGGTDGARLSFMGLPTPNLFTGGHNFHSKYEFIVVESMIKSVEVIVNISNLATELV